MFSLAINNDLCICIQFFFECTSLPLFWLSLAKTTIPETFAPVSDDQDNQETSGACKWRTCTTTIPTAHKKPLSNPFFEIIAMPHHKVTDNNPIGYNPNPSTRVNGGITCINYRNCNSRACFSSLGTGQFRP